MKTYNPAIALKLYYTRTEIGNADIRALFGCASCTATKLKQEVQQVMVERKVRTWNKGNIDIATAYELWGINVESVERRMMRLQKLQEAGIV